MTIGLDTLITFLSKKDKNERYDPHDPRNCLLSQYGQRMFGSSTWMGEKYLHLPEGHKELIPQFMRQIAYTLPHTFGAACERAVACVTKQQGETS